MKLLILLGAGAIAMGLVTFSKEKCPMPLGSFFEVKGGSEPVCATGNPEELGAVHWERDYEKGLEAGRQTNKPLFILFQEVPGCSNCTRFGREILSHPLVVEAIESHFIPVCIYNNKKGKDADVLKQYGEPAWNNPVVRIVDSKNQTDLTPRMPDFQSAHAIVEGMGNALLKSGVEIPQYLQLLEAEFLGRETGLETATLSMYCFWSGEGAIGKIPGVVSTLPGFQNGREVVQVQFDPSVVDKNTVKKMSASAGTTLCADNAGFRPDKEPKYYLAQTHYRFVPMIEIQAARANSLIGNGQSPDSVLSPRQIAFAKKVAANPDGNWENMIGKYPY